MFVCLLENWSTVGLSQVSWSWNMMCFLQFVWFNKGQILFWNINADTYIQHLAYILIKGLSAASNSYYIYFAHCNWGFPTYNNCISFISLLMRINNPRHMMILSVITIIAADIFYHRHVNTECTHSVHYTALNLVLSDISSIMINTSAVKLKIYG